MERKDAFFEQSPSDRALHVGEQQLEAVAQVEHAGVGGAVQLEAVGDDLDGPVHELGVLAGLEAEVEVAGVLGVEAEDVHAALRVRFRVGRQPPLCCFQNPMRVSLMLLGRMG